MAHNRSLGVDVVGPGQRELVDIQQRDVTPRVSDEWLPELLEQLLPYAAEAVRSHAVHLYGDRVTEDHRYPLSFPFERLAAYGIDPLYSSDQSGESGLQGDYAAAIAEYAVRYHGRETDDLYRPERRDNLVEFLASIGTGKGPYNAGVAALDATIAPIFESLAPEVGCKRPRVRLYLNASEWADVDDARTAQRALDAVSTLAEGLPIEIVVSSPQLAKLLDRRHSEWLESVADLTDLREWFDSCGTEQTVTPDADTREIVASAVTELSDGSGRVRLLAALQTRDATVKALKRDTDVSLADGSIDRYTRDLEADGLVTIDDHTGRSNTVSLTDAGEIVADHIDTDYSLQAPSRPDRQGRSYADPSRERKYSVPSATRSGEGETARSADEWLAATGTADGSDGDYVRWLNGPDEQIDAFGQHQRLSAAKRVDGVNLVDTSIEAFEDGRTTYISCFDEELLTVLQWGGPLVTLGRLANALLSRRALSKVLGPDSVGPEFEELFGGASTRQSFEADLEDLIRMGTQVGWFGEDEEEWASWFDRIGGVRAAAMGELGAVVNSTDQERRAELFRDLHGLVATATAMYDAADVDVTIDLRIPDIHQLIDEESRFDQFLGFLQKTVTKQAMYRSDTGHHSWFRTCIEDREEKLKYRLSPGYSLEQPSADLTASWIIRGPTATELQTDIQEALETEISELRERIAKGAEAAPVLEVPVADATTLPHIRSVAREFASLKNYSLPKASKYTNNRFTDREFARLCIEFLATSDNPHRCNPSDVAEAMLRLSKTEFSGDQLTRSDVEYALSQLPADRLLPAKLPSKTKLFQALLTADKPLGRSGLLERVDVSGSTYDRHISDVRAEFRALGLLKVVSVGGHKRMVATLAPYWARDGDSCLEDDLEEDVVEEIDATVGEHAPGLSRRSRPIDVLFEVAAALDLDLQSGVWDPQSSLRDVYGLDPALLGWRPLLVGLLEHPLAEEPEESSESVATIGHIPDSISAQQVSLDQIKPIESETVPSDVENESETSLQ